MPTSRLEMSMSTAQLAKWLHWHVTWVRFLDSSSQPLADYPPVPPMLWRRKKGVSLFPSTIEIALELPSPRPSVSEAILTSLDLVGKEGPSTRGAEYHNIPVSS